MSPFLFNKRLKFVLRLDYPLHVEMSSAGFCAWYPDLPDVRLTDSSLSSLYSRIDASRREWLKMRVEAGEAIPMPHSGGVAEAPAREPARLFRLASV